VDRCNLRQVNDKKNYDDKVNEEYMKKITVFGLILFYVLSAAAQESDKTGSKQLKDQMQVSEQTKSHSSVQNNASAVQNQANVSGHRQTVETSPGKVPVKIVKNTRRGDKKIREKFGSAVDSGPRLILEKKNLKSKCTTAELQKVLNENKKMKPVRITAEQE
jgi:hypothetical protein